jgi:hypothetical protein
MKPWSGPDHTYKSEPCARYSTYSDRVNLLSDSEHYVRRNHLVRRRGCAARLYKVVR